MKTYLFSTPVKLDMDHRTSTIKIQIEEAQLARVTAPSVVAAIRELKRISLRDDWRYIGQNLKGGAKPKKPQQTRRTKPRRSST